MTLTRKILTAMIAATVLTGAAVASSSDVLAKGGKGGGGMGGGKGGGKGVHAKHHGHHGHHGHRHRHRHFHYGAYVTNYGSCWRWSRRTGWVNICVVPY